MQVIDVPFAPTNVAFGSKNLDRLFVNSMNRAPNVSAEGAARSRRPIAQLSSTYPGIDIEDEYRVRITTKID
jgi:sugar lactone lactonase YvrE